MAPRKARPPKDVYEELRVLVKEAQEVFRRATFPWCPKCGEPLVAGEVEVLVGDEWEPLRVFVCVDCEVLKRSFEFKAKAFREEGP